MARVQPAQRNSGTREVILEAAERLFAERGFAATSVRDIVSEAETSAPSLYHFFGSKENLVVELIADRHAAYCEELEGDLASAKTPFEVCQRFVKYVLTSMSKRPVTAKFLLGIMFGPQQDLPERAVGQTLARSPEILQDRMREVCRRGLGITPGVCPHDAGRHGDAGCADVSHVRHSIVFAEAAGLHRAASRRHVERFASNLCLARSGSEIVTP